MAMHVKILPPTLYYISMCSGLRNMYMICYGSLVFIWWLLWPYIWPHWKVCNDYFGFELKENYFLDLDYSPFTCDMRKLRKIDSIMKISIFSKHFWTCRRIDSSETRPPEQDNARKYWHCNYVRLYLANVEISHHICHIQK